MVMSGSSPPVVGETKVFERIESSKSGISFNNIVVENVATKENLFDFDYFYNGSGVGIADLNNDGQQIKVFYAH